MLIRYLLVFALGVCLGEKLIYNAYDPELLESRVIYTVEAVYASGCLEGVHVATKEFQHLDKCYSAANKWAEDYVVWPIGNIHKSGIK